MLLAGLAALPGGRVRAETPTPLPDPAVAARPTSPLYLSLSSRPATERAPDSRKGFTAEADPGFYLGGVVGYAFSDNLRAEIEAFYRRDGIGALSPRGRAPGMTFTPSAPASGGVSHYGGMARGYLEFGKGSSFQPYVGGGVGLATVEFDIMLDGARKQDEENLFAYEFMAGARYTITPRSSIRAGYRLSGTTDPDPGAPHAGDRIHAIEFGINYRF